MHYNALLRLKSPIMSTQSTLKDLKKLPGKSQKADKIFLTSIAQSVRAARSRRGMTRKQLARDADVSERLLAQLEMGEGNVSVVLLRGITDALNISFGDLFAYEKAPQPEKRSIQNLLSRLPEHRLQEVAQKLLREFGEDVKLRWSRLALIGLRGAGKSTLGAKIAKELKAPFVELDSEIEKDAGIPLAEIFSCTDNPATAGSNAEPWNVCCKNMSG